MTPATFVLAFVVCVTSVGCHTNMPANEMAKRSYQSYSPYNGTTQYYFDEIDDLDDITDSDEEDSKNEDDDLMYKNPRKLPSSECPRNEQQASFMGQECLRKCASDEDCKSKKKHCLCDGLCGMSCVKPERECDELPHPEHGQVIMTGRLFSDKATYSCELGYQLIGRDHRICHASGSWSGSNPYCKQSVFCKSPPVIENAVNNAFSDQMTFDVGSEVEYRCKDGFSMRGFAKAKCLAMDISASWYGPEITCEPRTCGPPPVIANGWHQGECSDFGCRVFYKCSDQYELIGKSERLCHSDGYWVPKDPPSCVPVDCGPPENPFNGNAVFTSTSYNSVVSYECKFGSLLSGEPTRRCGADGKWSGTTPICQEIDCGSPGELHNGWLENTESGTGLGATIIYRCQDGMLLVGNSSTVCLADGNWRYPPPLCLAPCVVPVIQHGGVNISLPNGTIPAHRKPGFPVLAKHGDKLVVKCDEKYEPEGGNSTLAACNNGTWTFIPKCEPAHCKRLPKIPKNGIVLAPYLKHGSKAKFSCKDGYVMSGNYITECQFGNWSGVTPKCEEVYCPFPGYIQHGKVLLVGSMGVYDYRPYVKKVKNNKQIVFECDKEYTLETGPVGATCIDGKWCPEILPKCMPSIHPKLRLSRSIKNDTACNDNKPTAEETNYSLITNAIETIKRWWTRSKRALSAQNQQVMKAKQTSNKDQAAKSPGAGRSRGRESGDTNFKDYDGEDVNVTVTATGEKNIHKSAKGKAKHLKRKVGPCEPLPNNTFTSFEVLKAGKHGNVTHSHGTIIKVTCKDGYHSNVVNNTAKCWRTHWKPAKPDCKLKPCLIPYPGNGYYSKVEPTYVNVSENAEIVDGEVLVVTCLPGFNLKGLSRITCIKGEWDVGSAIPECTPAPCELPSIYHGQYLLGYRAGLTIANGSFVTFQCDPEFIKTTSVSIECVLGHLVPKLPSCKRDGGLFITSADILKKSELGTIDLLSGLRGSCGPPESVQGSLVFRNGELLKEAEKSFPDGTEITFNCIGNIIGERVTWRIRCEDGNWIGRPLNCIPTKPVEETNSTSDNTTCMFRNSEPNVITFIGDSMITNELTEFNAGTVLVSRCSDIGKYAMEGSNKRVCINGEWSGQRPVCFGLNQENDYALEKPPTILFRHQLGPIAQSNEGKLVVYPGTILHMECLWIKRFGTPKWNISHSFRKYPEGWTTDPGRDPDLEYRLSIYHASRDDSGVFSCITPTRHMHSVEIIVKAVHCPSIPLKRSLTISTQNTKLNARVKFTCAKGNNLMGASEVVCLPSGNWSDPIPSCEIIECDEIENLTDPNLRVAVLSRQVGGEIMFSCMQGFGLTGPTHSICLPTGEWEQPFPTCAAVTCPWPGDPPHGYLAVTQNSYRPDERVSVNCEPYYVLDGQPNLICQDNGKWSAPLPTCVQACPYPGTVIRGRMSTVKFYYAIGDVITFSCDDNFHLKGASVLKCLKYGKWSNSIPTCVHKNETLLIV